ADDDAPAVRALAAAARAGGHPMARRALGRRGALLHVRVLDADRRRHARGRDVLRSAPRRADVLEPPLPARLGRPLARARERGRRARRRCAPRPRRSARRSVRSLAAADAGERDVRLRRAREAQPGLSERRDARRLHVPGPARRASGGDAAAVRAGVLVGDDRPRARARRRALERALAAGRGRRRGGAARRHGRAPAARGADAAGDLRDRDGDAVRRVLRPAAEARWRRRRVTKTPVYAVAADGLYTGDTMGAQVVCISRTDGALGEEIANLVAERLSLRYVDEPAIERAARLAQVDPKLVAAVEQRQRLLRGLIDKLAAARDLVG